MRISFIDKMRLLSFLYRRICVLPYRYIISTFLNPVDSVRYVEFSYLLKFISNCNLNGLNMLDVSSPYMIAYILSQQNNVVKTDIDILEAKFIKRQTNLQFKQENALSFSYPDNYFDLVYSISVIEHIYQQFTNAVREMIRVSKIGGVYLYNISSCKKPYRRMVRNANLYIPN